MQFMETKENTHSICVDCAIAHTNGDFSAMDEWTEAQVKSGMDKTGHLALIPDGDEYVHSDFVRTPCDGCGTTYAGYRYEAVTV